MTIVISHCINISAPGRRINVRRNGMVFEKIRAILSDYFEIDPMEITMETSITDDLDGDSLDMVDLTITIEDAFDVIIPDEDVEELRSVADLVNYIERRT